jgi:hypothetical protein
MNQKKTFFWDQHSCWEEAEKTWDEQACKCKEEMPLKSLKSLPNMMGITPETKLNLKRKSLSYLVKHDKDKKILKGFLKRPISYTFNYLSSSLKSQSFTKEGDFYYYGIKNEKELLETSLKEENLFVLGFSYCHKPFECPSGRFTDSCIRDPKNSTCRQCFIGKAANATDHETHVILITTIHHIGEKFFELIEKYPKKQITFIITACELTLNMFGSLGDMVKSKGIGIRLDGRICNTMQAFELSEKGIKPGLTVVLEDTQKKILEFLKERRNSVPSLL